MKDLPILSQLIAGKLSRPRGGPRLPVWNPATEEQIAWLPIAQEGEVASAVDSAAAAFADGRWSRLPASRRTEILNEVAELLESNAELLAATETADTGMTLAMTRGGHIPRSVAHFRHFAGECERLEGQCYAVDDAYLHLVQREPLGVVGILAPWNAPLAVATMNMAAALAAGNCVVLKSSERAPWSCSRLAELLAASDLPPGVVNVVHGPGEPTGASVVAHPGLDGLCFVGGTSTARGILSNPRHAFRRHTLELGGKSPTIVLADAPFDDAIDGALLSAFSSNGEVCTAGSRILVHGDLYDRFVDCLSRRVASIRVGDPREPSTEIGPLIDAAHRQSVEQHLRRAVDEGARLVVGGSRPEHLVRGFYLTPALLAEVSARHSIFREEVFGPVVGVTPFANEVEAMALANDTEYGLSATVWSADTARALALSRRLRCGAVGINTPLVRDIRVPFGGVKASGLGRVGGRWSIEQYTELKTTCLPVEGYPLPRLGTRGDR